jgi:hypothetical protein
MPKFFGVTFLKTEYLTVKEEISFYFLKTIATDVTSGCRINI